jgi:hypothetical protein
MKTSIEKKYNAYHKPLENHNKLGIWMDHQSAHLTEFSTEPSGTKTISSKFTQPGEVDKYERGEFLMHTREKQKDSDYYKKLGETIKNYSEVLLFGPTDAKLELYNLLRADHTFDKIKIDVVSADKMSENQQHALIKKHFSKH